MHEASARQIGNEALQRASRVIRVVGHPLRLRLLELLEGGQRNVTELVRGAGVSQAIVSQHLRILRAESVVDARREGARVFYWIAEPKLSMLLDYIRECDLPEPAQLQAPNGPVLRIVDARAESVSGPGPRQPSGE